MVTHNMLRTHERKWAFSDKNIRFVTALELIKCLKQVEEQRLRFPCVDELPSNMSTMISVRHRNETVV